MLLRDGAVWLSTALLVLDIQTNFSTRGYGRTAVHRQLTGVTSLDSSALRAVNLSLGNFCSFHFMTPQQWCSTTACAGSTAQGGTWSQIQRRSSS